jgi:hypothetical protein
MRLSTSNIRALAPRGAHHTPAQYLHLRTSPRPLASLITRQPCRVPNRGKKTKSSINLDDLPQGVIPLEPLPLEEDATPTYPTVVQQARTHMRKFENCVLLTKVGGFYELYFEHAEEFGPLLNLKVAQKKPLNAPAYSMVCCLH